MQRKIAPTLAGIALAAWSMFLLDTTYLEPLPWAAAWLGAVLLLVAAFGGGLLSGWRWWTLLVPPVWIIGLLRVSRDFVGDAEDSTLVSGLVWGVLLVVPMTLAILIGAFASRRTTHAANAERPFSPCRS